MTHKILNLASRPFSSCRLPQYENESSLRNQPYEKFRLHVRFPPNQTHFDIKNCCTRIRFEKQVEGNSEMAYLSTLSSTVYEKIEKRPASYNFVMR